MKKILSLLATLSLLISCQEEQNPVIEVSSISIQQEDMTLEEGESTMLSAVVLPEDADDKTIKWSSSDESKVIVSSAGKVIAMSLGKAVITAEAGKKTDFITITVVAKTVPVKGVSLNPAELTIMVGESGTITPDITPADATNKQVSWASSNTEIATIEDGTVTGIKPGSTTITATTDDGGLTAECIVTVKNNLAPSVTGEAEHISAVSAVLSGEANLDAELSSGTKMGIVWSAAAKEIPSDAEVVEATEIKANEEKVYSYSYSVKIPGLKENSTYYYCSFVTVNGESYYGDTQEFTTNELASLLESLEATEINASGATLNGKADLSEVGYVYEEGSVELGFLWGNVEDNLDKSVKCGELKEGSFSAVLTGLTHKTQYWYKAYVKLGEDVLYGSVKTFSTGSVPVESISLDITEHIFHSVGESINLKATISPEDASNKEIKWESEDEKVATVDENGKVTAIGNGTTTITVTTLDQNKKATCTISVAQAVTGIILTPSSTTIKESAFIELVPTISPANAANKNVIWASNNTAVATVNNGVVTGVSPGSAIITVTTEDGGKTATCSVVVESNLAPSVTVGAEHISTVSVVLMGKANLGSTVSSDLKVGFQYSRSAGILPSNSITIDAENVQADYSYSNSITGLEPATTYYYRSFVRQNNVDTYGETKAFTTKDVTALLETKDAIGVEATKATLNGKLDLTDAQYASISYGFYWGTSANSQNNHLKGGAIADNSYTANLSGLSHKTQYWYKAYVTLDSQTFSGEVKTFTTDVVPVESVSLNKEVYTFNTIGNTLTLIATVLPAEATDKSVAWTSDNTAVATVDSYGKVTARGNGTAKITVTTTDQHKTASCVITVAQWVTGISLDKTSITLNEGQEQTLTPTINPSNAANKSLRWTSSNTSVATVDADGKVTAVSKGTATIKAEAKDGSGKYANCSVTVKRLVSSIQLNKTSISIYNGKSEPLTATVIPSDASNTSVTWTSSNTSVATVSSSGMVTGKSRGIATISVTANDGSGAHATCEVEVKQYVTSITLDKTSITLNEGQEQTLIPTVNPSNAADKSLNWTSSNTSVATVNAEGKVTAVSKGTATIKAEAKDGSEEYASCSVTVNRLVSSIQLNKKSISIYNGKTESLTATVIPSDANNTNVTWTSSDTSVATVSSSGVVTGKSRGIATITVMANDGSGALATCTVEVKQYVTSITLDKTSLSLLVDAEATLSVISVLPDNANDKSYTWSSFDSAIVSVDNSGKVTARAYGTATITATANDGSGVNATCSVVVSSKCPTGAVDMGTTTAEGYKLYWAVSNIGASKPEDYGDYYAWGETEPKPKEDYSWSTYKFGTSSSGPFSKYNNKSSYGPVDNRTVLDPADDVAQVKLGGKWRMPTDAEWAELRTKCTWTWTDNYNGTGVKGRIVTSSNGNSIFLPAAGGWFGTKLSYAGSGSFFWSSSLYAGSPDRAWYVSFGSSNVLGENSYRCYGFSVRPVSE